MAYRISYADILSTIPPNSQRLGVLVLPILSERPENHVSSGRWDRIFALVTRAG